MKISSTVKDQSAYDERYVVLDSITPLGAFHISLGIGRFEGRQGFLTEVGLAAYHRLNHLVGTAGQKLHLVNVTSALKAREVVPREIMKSKAGDSIFFACKDPAVYDKVSDLLCIAVPAAAEPPPDTGQEGS